MNSDTLQSTRLWRVFDAQNARFHAHPSEVLEADGRNGLVWVVIIQNDALNGDCTTFLEDLGNNL